MTRNRPGPHRQATKSKGGRSKNGADEERSDSMGSAARDAGRGGRSATYRGQFRGVARGRGGTGQGASHRGSYGQ
jgi:hypothetical protein